MNDKQRLWLLLVAVLIIALFLLLEPILTPFLVAGLLAYLGDPLADRLEARGMGRTVAVTLVFSALILLLITAVVLTIPLVGRQLDLLAHAIPQWLEQLQLTLIPWLQKTLELPQGSLPIAEFKTAISNNWVTAGSMLGQLWGKIAGSSLAMIAGLANLVLIPVVTFYLLRDWDTLMSHIRDLLPRSIEPTVVKLTNECDEIIGAFIRGQLLSYAGFGDSIQCRAWVCWFGFGIDFRLDCGACQYRALYGVLCWHRRGKCRRMVSVSRTDAVDRGGIGICGWAAAGGYGANATAGGRSYRITPGCSHLCDYGRWPVGWVFRNITCAPSGGDNYGTVAARPPQLQG